MNVLILEDEPYQSDILTFYLKEQVSDINIVAEFSTIAETRDFFQSASSNSVDLIFMDVELKDGCCFRLFTGLDHVPKVSVPVVFLTAHSKYSLDAFHANCVHFLVKPITPAKLYEAISKYESMRSFFSHNGNGIKKSNGAIHPNGRIVLKVGNKNCLIDPSEIAYFHLKEKLVYLYKHNGDKMIIDSALDDLMDRLGGSFFRANRQSIVSLSAVRKYYSTSRGRLKIDLEPVINECEVLVSFKNRSDFLSWVRPNHQIQYDL